LVTQGEAGGGSTDELEGEGAGSRSQGNEWLIQRISTRQLSDLILPSAAHEAATCKSNHYHRHARPPSLRPDNAIRLSQAPIVHGGGEDNDNDDDDADDGLSRHEHADRPTTKR
jgi:hypothetical protein